MTKEEEESQTLLTHNSFDLPKIKEILYESVPSSPKDDFDSKRTLGTFTGVFAPVSLAMFSSVLFLRIGYIVGNAGLLETLLQFLIAYIILVATVSSISAIASNGAVEDGGVYFMMSRTLGPELGGAIGILFYFANVVSSALYLAACTEGILNSFGPLGNIIQILPGSKWWNFLYSSCTNSINLFICLVGSKLFGRTSVFVLTIVSICILTTFSSFFSSNSFETNYKVTSLAGDCESNNNNNGTHVNCTKILTGHFQGLFSSSSLSNLTTKEIFSRNLFPKYAYDCSESDDSLSFFVVFGVLFSGVTGIMSGANLCGELKTPSKNIPKGTFLACATTFMTFISLSFFTSLTCDPIFLQHDCMYMNRFSFWSPIIFIGMFLATFSASLSNLIGASRILIAVSKDFLYSPFLSYVNNPLLAVLWSWILVEAFLLMGSLNSIAILCSVLFLMSYFSINMSCLFLHLASAPNFRPSFKYFSSSSCLIGLLGTSVMMFAISPMFSAVAILLCLSLALVLNVYSPIPDAYWGSIGQALLFHQVRKYLLLLDPRKLHVKFWRPQILLLVSNPRTTCALIDFVNALKKGGLYILGHVVVKDLQDCETDPISTLIPQWLNLVDHLKIKAFVELTLSSNIRYGFQQLIRISGIGAMKPNTVILGFLDDTFPHDDFTSPGSSFKTILFDSVFPNLNERQNKSSLTKIEYVGIILDVLKLKKNICLCRHFQSLNTNNVFRFNKSRKNKNIFGVPLPRKKEFLDVWLIDFFSRDGTTNITDTSSLFLLQLACIVNMAPRWKTLRIRVFIQVKDESSESIKLKELLECLRIPAFPQYISQNNLNVLNYGDLTEIRDMVRSYCESTAVVFLYLPTPPQNEEYHESYINNLTTLTNLWPPTLLVRGIDSVTSTEL